MNRLSLNNKCYIWSHTLYDIHHASQNSSTIQLWVTFIFVTTCLVVLSSRLWFWKIWQKRRTPRRTVMGTTNRQGGLVPKYLEFWKMGTEIDSLNFVTEWQDGPSQTLQRNWVSKLCDGAAKQTVAGATGRHRLHNPRQGRISVNVLRDVFGLFLP